MLIEKCEILAKDTFLISNLDWSNHPYLFRDTITYFRHNQNIYIYNVIILKNNLPGKVDDFHSTIKRNILF